MTKARLKEEEWNDDNNNILISFTLFLYQWCGSKESGRMGAYSWGCWIQGEIEDVRKCYSPRLHLTWSHENEQVTSAEKTKIQLNKQYFFHRPAIFLARVMLLFKFYFDLRRINLQFKKLDIIFEETRRIPSRLFVSFSILIQTKVVAHRSAQSDKERRNNTSIVIGQIVLLFIYSLKIHFARFCNYCTRTLTLSFISAYQNTRTMNGTFFDQSPIIPRSHRLTTTKDKEAVPRDALVLMLF